MVYGFYRSQFNSIRSYKMVLIGSYFSQTRTERLIPILYKPIPWFAKSSSRFFHVLIFFNVSPHPLHCSWVRLYAFSLWLKEKAQKMPLLSFTQNTTILSLPTNRSNHTKTDTQVEQLNRIAIRHADQLFPAMRTNDYCTVGANCYNSTLYPRSKLMNHRYYFFIFAMLIKA